jgi:hypothetical protein
MEHGGRHAYSHRWWLPAMLLAVLVASAAIGAGFVEWRLRGGDESATAPASTTGAPDVSGASGASTPAPSDGSSPTAPSARSAETRLDSCRTLFAQELQALLAADASMEQWQLHIDAMNQLVAGKITLAEATAYWSATRKGAIHRVHRFRRLDDRLTRSQHECAGGRGSAGPHLTACVQATRAVGRTLASARTATRTWRQHIHEMEMLRRGDISPTRALNMWVAMWHTGQDQVERYSHRTMKSLRERCA